MKPLHAFALLLISAAAATAQTNLWQNSGNIGIGTTSPNAKLVIANGGNGKGLEFSPDYGSESYIETFDRGAGVYSPLVLHANYQRFMTSGGEVMRLTSSGNVGIGTSNPSSRLDVNGGISSTLSDGSSYALLQAKNDVGAVLQTITFGSAKTGTTFGLNNANISAIYTTATISQSPSALAIGTYGSNSPLVFGTNGNERMRIDQNGNVCVGITDPDRGVFHIRGANRSLAGTTSILAITTSDAVAADIGGSLHFGAHYDTGNDCAPLGYVAGRRENALTNNFAGYLQFGVTQGNAGTIEAMRVASSGNVGIGTTNPTEKLSVNGRIRAKEVIVDTNWSDYVFAKDYKLASLSEVEQHIQQQGHLPGVPSATEVAEKGVSVGDMQAVLLAKVEELTLHLIAQEKHQAAQQQEIARLRENEAALRAEMQQLRQTK
jgi:hypothetical protein